MTSVPPRSPAARDSLPPEGAPFASGAAQRQKEQKKTVRIGGASTPATLTVPMYGCASRGELEPLATIPPHAPSARPAITAFSKETGNGHPA